MSPSAKPSPVTEESEDLAALLGPDLAAAFARKGYTSLTKVQRAMLEPALADRDLRVSSQTGSGKTVAIGLSLRHVLLEASSHEADARAKALVIVPTRELAAQVQEELSWLYAPVRLRVAVVTGGASYRDEHRALARGPRVIVGTPGRLLDHLRRGAIDASGIQVVVLDEADRMLDLGFREELEAILGALPAEHRTHLVSATFARDVNALADRVQKQPMRVEGTPLGSANLDIDHVLYLVDPRERVDALINVLLQHSQDQTLVFARTRAEVGDIARELQVAGFAAGALTGDMEQAERMRALGAFKRGQLRALIATDVAARGIDVQDVARVVQVDVPSGPDPYTHRSGRTGRAGRKGTSVLMVPPSAMRRAVAILQQARVQFRIEPVPSAASIRAAQDERWLAELAAEAEDTEISERVRAQAARVVERGLTERALSRLLSQVQQASGQPREVTVLEPGPRPRSARERGQGKFADARDRRRPGPFAPATLPPPAEFDERPRAANAHRGPRDAFPNPGPRSRNQGEGWVPFSVSWGEAHGADARRLVAMLCRRGQIQSGDIGAIRVAATHATVEVSASVAERFELATRKPDSRDPRVKVTPLGERSFAEPQRPDRDEGAESPPPRAPRPFAGSKKNNARNAEAAPSRPRAFERPARPAAEGGQHAGGHAAPKRPPPGGHAAPKRPFPKKKKH